MPSIPELALAEARELGLDLSVQKMVVETSSFTFKCLEPRESMLQAFRRAHTGHRLWVNEMPVPVLTLNQRERKFRIMDGMLRICSAKRAGFKTFPALVANGETYDALEPILAKGYYGEDFIEMLAMVNPLIRENLAIRKYRFLSGS